MPRPFDNEYPVNRHVCRICGGAFGFEAGVDDGAAYKQYRADHELCHELGAPAAGCLVDGCGETAVGPAQRCAAHGGGKKNVKDRRATHGQ